MTETDRELLILFTRDGSEDAFTEIVRRYVGVVYSAALRQVRSPQLAEEVAQCVFLKLARTASGLKAGTLLASWLYQVTRRQAIDVIRREARRQSREKAACEETAMNSNPDCWPLIEPLLDEAIHALDDKHRDAIILRYLQNKTLREVGAALGMSENGAQKRVARALELLRIIFQKRGVTLGIGGLAASLATHGAQGAPASLVSSISSTVLSSLLLPPAIFSAQATKFIIMTTLQKLTIATAITVVVTAGIYTYQKGSGAEPSQNSKVRVNAAIHSISATRRRTMLPASKPSGPMGANEEQESKDRINRILNSTNWPALSDDQVEKFLNLSRRSAASLLAVFRANGDVRLLDEALQTFPHDPQVTFAAVFRDNSPDEQLLRLEAFKQSAPDNALGNYLSAINLLKSGQSAKAIEELKLASGKSQFTDYSMTFRQNAEDAYRSADYSEAEAKVIAAHSLLLPHLVDLNQFGQSMVNLATAYRNAGDPASAEAALQLGVKVGQRIGSNTDDPTLTTQLLGLAIERQSLRALDPNQPFGSSGQTVKDRIDQLGNLRIEAQGLAKKFNEAQPNMGPQDWISYIDRVKNFGEMSAMKWYVQQSGK